LRVNRGTLEVESTVSSYMPFHYFGARCARRSPCGFRHGASGAFAAPRPLGRAHPIALDRPSVSMFAQRLAPEFAAACAVTALASPSYAARRASPRSRVPRRAHACAACRGEGWEGSAPSTQALREHLAILWGQQQRCVETSDATPRTWQHRQAFAQWASRWKRWGGRVGVFRARDHVPIDVRRRRPAGLVWGGQLRISSVLGTCFWSDFGFGFGPHFWNQF